MIAGTGCNATVASRAAFTRPGGLASFVEAERDRCRAVVALSGARAE